MTQKVIWISVVIVLSLFGAILYLSFQNKTLRATVADLETFSKTETKDSTDRNPLQTIDKLLFSGRYLDALQQYQELQADSAYQNHKEELLARLAVTRSLIANASTPPTQPATPSKQDSTAVAATPSDHNVTNNQIALATKNTDSLENKITDLNRKLSARERALEEKEQLKAITIQGPTGQTIQYVGDTKNGMAHGTGTGVWDASGGTYNGDWKENKRDGYGVYNWKDGVRYEGEFRQDKREGKGSYYWPSGERYVGQWKNNQRHGQGVLYDKDGNVSYDGNWENDKTKRK
ncbi:MULTISPECIES: PLD nuclease N-terminal domain-containing protein [Sphingobacterium]|uniref:MORN repeat protein n=1 Tax=Sphingobacterium populi TaxID=1812824 RepID=A0ABW5UBZ3_9SPHI|nr:PLD nuclease N-terminal domain-containing protein [Sphingobacterium sp. CFCC 11742]